MEEDAESALEVALDDVSGAALDPAQARRARHEEIDYVRTALNISARTGALRQSRQGTDHGALG